MIKREKISISIVSVLSLVFLTTIVFCFFGFIYYEHQKKVKLSELNSNIAKIADMGSDGLSIAVWEFNEELILGILKRGLFDKNVSEMMVEFGKENETVISVQRDKKAGHKALRNKISFPADRLLFQRDLMYLNEKVGKLTVSATPEFIKKKLKEDVIIIVLFTLFLAVLIIIGVYCIFYLIVIKPLKYFEAFALSVNFENYNSSQAIEKKFFKELDNLSFSIQNMVTSLNSNYKNLENSERKFKDMANLLPQPLMESDLAGNLTFINQKGLDLFGISKADFEKGLNIHNLVVPEDKEKTLKNKSLIIDGKNFVNGNEYMGRKKDGSVFPAVFYTSVILEEGRPIGLRGVGIDLSEQRKNEAALNELTRLNFIKEKEAEKIKTLSLIEGQEKERLRISKEIHDGIGQMMTGIKLSIESISPDLVKEEIEKIEYTKTLVYEVIAELRQISRDLSPTFLYEYGLYPAVSQLVNGISRINVINIQLNSNIQKERFPALVEITLYRIIQETLNNTLKYSKAQNLLIELMQDAEFFELNIEDDGMGFDNSGQMDIDRAGGNGLKNISSRANLIGANLTIASAHGKGFKMNLQIPL